MHDRKLFVWNGTNYLKHCQWLLLNGCRNSQPHSPPPLSELWRASFARSVALRLFLLAQKKTTYGIPDGLPSVAYDEDLKEFRSSASVLGDKDFLARLSSKAGRLFLRPGRPKNSVIKL